MRLQKTAWEMLLDLLHCDATFKEFACMSPATPTIWRRRHLHCQVNNKQLSSCHWHSALHPPHIYSCVAFKVYDWVWRAAWWRMDQDWLTKIGPWRRGSPQKWLASSCWSHHHTRFFSCLVFIYMSFPSVYFLKALFIAHIWDTLSRRLGSLRTIGDICRYWSLIG